LTKRVYFWVGYSFEKYSFGQTTRRQLRQKEKEKGLDEQKRDLQVDADLLGEASATHSHTQTDALRNFATWSAYVYHSCQNTKGQMDFNEHLISGLPDDTFSN
jgi:hypothetical protein